MPRHMHASLLAAFVVSVASAGGAHAQSAGSAAPLVLAQGANDPEKDKRKEQERQKGPPGDRKGPPPGGPPAKAQPPPGGPPAGKSVLTPQPGPDRRPANAGPPPGPPRAHPRAREAIRRYARPPSSPSRRRRRTEGSSAKSRPSSRSPPASRCRPRAPPTSQIPSFRRRAWRRCPRVLAPRGRRPGLVVRQRSSVALTQPGRRRRASRTCRRPARSGWRRMDGA